MGRWRSKIGKLFLNWLGENFEISDSKWLDVGCGTGVLSELIYTQTNPRSILGIDPSQEYITRAKQKITNEKIDFKRAFAEKIPLKDETVDIIVSGLALNFMEDPTISLKEMQRVVKSNGIISCYVWDYSEKMEFLRYFWDAVIKTDPKSIEYDEGVKFPICNPKMLHNLFTSCDLKDVMIKELVIRTRFSSFDDYWRPFLEGQGPSGDYLNSINAEKRNQIATQINKTLPFLKDGSIDLMAKAFAICGKR